MPVDDTTIARVMRRIYNLGVRPAWWKIEPPSREAWPYVLETIAAYDPHCNGVLLLGLDAPEDECAASVRRGGAVPPCRGFAVGRSIFGPRRGTGCAARSTTTPWSKKWQPLRSPDLVWQGLRA